MTSSLAGGFIAVIPARLNSIRLPGKPLLDIAGKAMVLRVVERAMASEAKDVYVATDNDSIRAACENEGIKVCMTDAAHPSGTDRIAEVARQLKLASDAIIVNVQGDEPLIPPAVINQVAANLSARPDVGICTLFSEILDTAEFANPNIVKLVTDNAGGVMYFSRAQIPFPRDGMNETTLHAAKRHVGLYAYRVNVLQQFVQWPQAMLEQTEKLEQLRAMANGIKIHAELCCQPIPPGVDTPEDLEHVRRLITTAGKL
ncbi:MAG: 3-deoxy-manno-octulosonate cytidylyltransferase [Pseudomonadota bacterium]